MSVTNQDNKVSYVAEGQTTYAIPFYFAENSHIKVYIDEVLKDIGTHYTLTGATDPAGGELTIVGTAPDDEETVIILREVPVTQPNTFSEGGPFQAKTIEAMFDRVTHIAQQIKEQVSRAIKFPLSSSVDTQMTGEVIPGAMIIFNDDGTALEVGPNAVQYAAGVATNSAAAVASAAAAAASATGASNSATSATSSATSATNSATAAAASATAAASSTTSAGTSATSATASQGAAATSATAAAASATTAGTAATNASTSASGASTSASQAATSATNAGASATNANNSAIDSANSATASASSATASAASASAAATSEANVSNKAPLASPALTGTPTAPTATLGTNTTQLATTAFVKAAIDSTPGAQALAALDVDWSQGQVFWKEVSANSALTFSNVTDGKIISVIIKNTSGASITLTIPTVINSSIDLVVPAAKENVYTFIRSNSKTYATALSGMS